MVDGREVVMVGVVGVVGVVGILSVLLLCDGVGDKGLVEVVRAAVAVESCWEREENWVSPKCVSVCS